MSESLISLRGRASDRDYAENLLRSDLELIPQSRRPYVLARIALSSNMSYPASSHNALQELHEANKAGILEPPLSTALSNEIESILVERSELIHDDSFAAVVLLNMAIDEGSRPSA